MKNGQQYCTFFLSKYFFGIKVERVQEVTRDQVMTRVPVARKVIKGLMNLRGHIVTVVDLKQMLELPEKDEIKLPMHVVVRAGDERVSFLVDEIGDVIEIDLDNFLPPPGTLKGIGKELIQGAYPLKDKLLLVLDPDKTIEAAFNNGKS